MPPGATRDTTVIAGGGLAGACVAFCLSRRGGSVLLLEKEAPGAGASGAAAGLANPFMARKARPTWRLKDALGALRWIVRAAGAEAAFDQTGVLRPARSEKQAGFFRQAAEEHPAQTAWLPAGAARERFPVARSPHGALWIAGGGAADVSVLIEALIDAAREHGAHVETRARVAGWAEHAGSVTVEVAREEKPSEQRADGQRAGGQRASEEVAEEIEAGRLLLCVGQGFGALPGLASLGLRAVKGQTLRLRRPTALEGQPLPSLSGTGYVVPRGGGELLAGSTYEHDFANLEPTAGGRQRILEKVSQMVPALAEAEVVETRAGARVSPPGSHLPAVGPLPGHVSGRVWAFTALGSRGLLTAPLLARELPSFLEAPARIPEVVRARAA